MLRAVVQYGWPLVLVAVCVLVFLALLWLALLIFDVDPGWTHRWRPWLAIAVLWCLYGLVLRVGLQFLIPMLVTTPGQLLWLVPGWPVMVYLALLAG